MLINWLVSIWGEHWSLIKFHMILLKVIADFEFFICGLDMAIGSITTEVFSKMFFL